MKQLCLIRGLPGSGKTTVADMLMLVHGYAYTTWVETDKQFMEGGVYRFDPAKLGPAHALSQLQANTAMRAGTPIVIISNTFSQKWEMEIYLMLAEIWKYDVSVTDLFDAGLTDEQLAARCVHGVPVEKIAQMRQRWEP